MIRRLAEPAYKSVRAVKVPSSQEGIVVARGLLFTVLQIIHNESNSAFGSEVILHYVQMPSV